MKAILGDRGPHPGAGPIRIVQHYETAPWTKASDDSRARRFRPASKPPISGLCLFWQAGVALRPQLE